MAKYPSMTNYRILLLLLLLYDRRQYALDYRKASAQRLYESSTNFQVIIKHT